MDNLDPENDAAVDPAFLAELREADPQDANSPHVGDVEAEGNVRAGGLNILTIDESAGIASPFEALEPPPDPNPETASSRDCADWLVRLGIPVIKIMTDPDLTPKGGFKDPESRNYPRVDPESVHDWFSDPFGNSTDDNIAIAMGELYGRNLVGFDCDEQKPGAKESREKLEAEGLPIDTLTFGSPSGGTHRIYELPSGVRICNDVDLLNSYPGIDLRGEHGFLYTLGTYRYANPKKPDKPAGYYRVSRAAPIAKLPAHLVAKIAEPAQAAPARGEARVAEGVEIDSDGNRARALAYLMNEAPQAIERAGGRRVSMAVLQRLLDLGCSYDEAIDLMLEYWNEAKADPPWDDDELRATFRGIEGSRQTPLGSRTAAAVFGPDEGDGDGEDARGRAEKEAKADDDKADGDKTLADLKAKLRVVSASSYKGRRAPPMEWFAPDLIPAFNLTVLNGDGGVGKSLLVLQAQACSVAKREWLGMPLRHGPAIFVSGEDDADENHRRLERIAEAEGIDFDALADLHIINLAGRNATLLAKGMDGSLALSMLYRDLAQLVTLTRPASLAIDNAALTFGGNEIDRGEVATFTSLLNELSTRERCATVLLAHPSITGMTSGTGSSGSTQWSNGARGRLWLRRPKEEDERKRDRDVRVLQTMKQNYAAGVDEERRLRWEAGRFIPLGAQIVSEVDVESFLMRKIEEFLKRGQNVSANSGARTGTVYAPLIIAKDSEAKAKGIGQDALVKAMDALLTRDWIFIDKVRTSSSPNKTPVLRVREALREGEGNS